MGNVKGFIFVLFFLFSAAFGQEKGLNELLAKYSSPSYYNPKKITELIQEGADVNTPNKWGNPPLTIAVLKKNLQLIEFLILKGADIHLKNPKGFSPFDFAQKSGDKTVIDLLGGGELAKELQKLLDPKNYDGQKIIDLVKKGASVKTHNDWGDTPLIMAVIREDEKVVRFLKEHGADPGVVNKKGVSAIDFAKKLKSRKILDLLIGDRPNVILIKELSKTPFDKDLIKKVIQKGADIDGEDEKGITPLLKSVENRNVELTRFLLSLGASPYKENSNGESPYRLAKKKGYKKILVLLEKKMGPTLEGLLTKNTFERVVVMERINLGANVDSLGEDGKTPIFFATEKKDFKLVKFLIENNADLSIKDVNGQSVLDVALIVKNSKIRRIIMANLLTNIKRFSSKDYFDERKVRVLIEMGAPIKYLNNDGDTLLISAVRNEKQDLFFFLLKKGAGLFQKNKKGESVSDLVKSGLLPQLESFLEKNSLNFELKKYLTFKSFDSEKIKEIIEKGGDVNTVNSMGNTVLIMAVLKQDEDLINFLLKKGANPDLKNPKGFSAAMFANRYPSIKPIFSPKPIENVDDMIDSKTPIEKSNEPLTIKEKESLNKLYFPAEIWKNANKEMSKELFKSTFSIPFNYQNLKKRKKTYELDIPQELRKYINLYLDVENKKEETIGTRKVYIAKLTIVNKTNRPKIFLLDLSTEGVPENYCAMKTSIEVPAKRVVKKEIKVLTKGMKNNPDHLLFAFSTSCPVGVYDRLFHHQKTKKIKECSNLYEGKRRTLEIYESCSGKLVKKEGTFEGTYPYFKEISRARTYGKYKAMEKANDLCLEAPGIVKKEFFPKDVFFKCQKNSRSMWSCSGKASLTCQVQELKFPKSKYVKMELFKNLVIIYERVISLYEGSIQRDFEIASELDALNILAKDQLRQIEELKNLINLEGSINEKKISCILREKLIHFVKESRKVQACMKDSLFPKVNVPLKKSNTFEKILRYPDI